MRLNLSVARKGYSRAVCEGMQMLESENREYGPLVLGKGRDWRILGKVLWLVRQTP